MLTEKNAQNSLWIIWEIEKYFAYANESLKKHPFDKVAQIACGIGGGRVICTIPKRKGVFSGIPSQ